MGLMALKPQILWQGIYGTQRALFARQFPNYKGLCSKNQFLELASKANSKPVELLWNAIHLLLIVNAYKQQGKEIPLQLRIKTIITCKQHSLDIDKTVHFFLRHG